MIPFFSTRKDFDKPFDVLFQGHLVLDKTITYKTIVEQHKGTLDVKSEVNKGTEVVVGLQV